MKGTYTVSTTLDQMLLNFTISCQALINDKTLKKFCSLFNIVKHFVYFFPNHFIACILCVYIPDLIRIQTYLYLMYLDQVPYAMWFERINEL